MSQEEQSNNPQPQPQPQQHSAPPASDIECGMCGRDGGPQVQCEVCKGSPRFAQKRHYTLSEERRGLNEEERNDRYGQYGEVGPKVVNLPGSFNPFGPKTNK